MRSYALTQKYENKGMCFLFKYMLHRHVVYMSHRRQTVFSVYTVQNYAFIRKGNYKHERKVSSVVSMEFIVQEESSASKYYKVYKYKYY